MAFMSEYERLTGIDQAFLRNAIQRLVFTGSLQSKHPGDKEYYETAIQFQPLIQEWLAVADILLLVDEHYGVMRIAPSSRTPSWEIAQIRSRDELAMLAILRMAIEEARAHTGAGLCRITISELKTRYEDKLKMKLAAKRLMDVLPKFRSMKLIDYKGAADEADTSLLVLPLIFVITPESFDQIIDDIQVQSEIVGENENDETE